MAAGPSRTPGCNFGLSGKQCKQLIKHLRSKAVRVAAFMWVSHPSSSRRPRRGSAVTSTAQLSAVASGVTLSGSHGVVSAGRDSVSLAAEPPPRV